MFASSTQRHHWMFSDEEGIVAKRKSCHEEYVSMQRSRDPSIDFLSLDECLLIFRFFEQKLMEFCVKFKPPMPKGVQGTASHYFKRFYLNNSVMDYHPKEILVTAAYLACKVEEFNVSIEQFVANIMGNKERAIEIILNNELLLMKELNFQLTIHNPFRPVEGLLIDIKTRFKDLSRPEDLRPGIEKFLEDIHYTNAGLIYAPSQIALAAITFAASKSNQNIDSYVTDVLFGGYGQEKVMNIIEAVRNIRLMVKNIEPPMSAAQVKDLNAKLERCRNQENNPDSQAYKRKLKRMFEEEEERYDTMGAQSKYPRLDDGLQGISEMSPS